MQRVILPSIFLFVCLFCFFFVCCCCCVVVVVFCLFFCFVFGFLFLFWYEQGRLQLPDNNCKIWLYTKRATYAEENCFRSSKLKTCRGTITPPLCVTKWHEWQFFYFPLLFALENRVCRSEGWSMVQPRRMSTDTSKAW